MGEEDVEPRPGLGRRPRGERRRAEQPARAALGDELDAGVRRPGRPQRVGDDGRRQLEPALGDADDLRADAHVVDDQVHRRAHRGQECVLVAARHDERTLPRMADS